MSLQDLTVLSFPGRPRTPADRMGEVACLAGVRGDREQEVVELNAKVPVRAEGNKNQESPEVKV